jgi:cholesterol transport system auxiliary component
MAIGAAAAVFALAACSSGPPAASFDLSQPPTRTKWLHPRHQLVVVDPAALQPLDSNDVIVRRQDGTLATLAQAQWSDRLPRVVQTRLIQAFENAGAVGHVGFSGGPITPDLTLDLEIRAFELDVGAGEARVQIAAKLLAAGTGRVVAARIFDGQASITGSGPERAHSLDQALGSVLGEMVRWAAPHL